MRSRLWIATAGVLLLLGPASALAAPCSPTFPDRAAQRGAAVRADGSAPSDAAVRAQLSGLRLPFVANQGQADAQVAYYVSSFGTTLFVTHRGELVYALRGGDPDAPRGTLSAPREGFDGPRVRRRASPRSASLTETLVGGRARPLGQDPSPSGVSDFRGNDPARWRQNLPTYEQLGLGEVWPGISVSLQARGGRVEKVFTVQPGGSVDQIRVRVRGARALTVDADGALVATTRLGDVTFTPPVAYQERDGARREVSVSYRLDGQQYGFEVGPYDPTLPLVIDPLLQSTLLGGNDDDFVHAIAIHPTTGDVYVAGDTFSPNFPGVAGGYQSSLAGGCGCAHDAFVARLSRDLKTLIQATYLGGTDDDGARALAIHPTTGDVYVAGFTFSSDFPKTLGGAEPNPAGILFDGFVARLASNLQSLTQSTYVGGTTGSQQVNALAIHPTTHDVYVTGFTTSDNFPGTSGSAQPGLDGVARYDAFIARLNSSLTPAITATYLGGTGVDEALAIAIHPTTGDVYVAGRTTSTDFPGTSGSAQPTPGSSQDAFVARVNSNLTPSITATYLGGSGDDTARGVAIHPVSGYVYVVGDTYSVDFPGTGSGAQTQLDNGALGGFGRDAFVARFNSSLSAPLFRATYLGGSDEEVGHAVAIHPRTGEVYVAGSTGLPLPGPVVGDFPFTDGGAQPVFGGCQSDAFIARLATDLSSVPQATYLGGDGFDGAEQPDTRYDRVALAIATDTGDIYVAGNTDGDDSPPFPGLTGGAQATFGGGDWDGFVARLTSRLTAVEPDLTITKTHVGNFSQGQVGATYTITVSNVGTAPTDGTTVTVADTLPVGLTATALSGSGWTCTLVPLQCTRSTPALAISASYPAITLTVTVASTAAASLSNTATVSGGGDGTFGNNMFTNPTTIVPKPDLTITKTHTGNFGQGQVGATYTITVTNSGGAATDGSLVTVTDTLPAGFTATALAGGGWTCTLALLRCTRSSVLAIGASYPAMTLTVNVAANVPSGSVTNTATVSGGGDPISNTANDPTTVGPAPNLTIDISHTGSFTWGQSGTYTIVVTNAGTAPTDLGVSGVDGDGGVSSVGSVSGESSDAVSVAMDGNVVTVTITLPPGLTATALGGSGWSCTLVPLRCTRSDSLPAGASYPPITLTVFIALGTPTPATVTVTVTVNGDVNTTNNTDSDPTVILTTTAVPALSTVGQVVMVLVLFVTGLLFLRRRRARA